MMGGEEQSPPTYPHHMGELEPKQEYGEPEYTPHTHGHHGGEDQESKDTTNIGGYNVDKAAECRVKVEPDTQGYVTLPPFMNWLELGLCPSRGKYWLNLTEQGTTKCTV